MNILILANEQLVYPVQYFKDLDSKQSANYTCLPTKYERLCLENDVTVLNRYVFNTKLKENPAYSKHFDNIYIAIKNNWDTEEQSVMKFVEKEVRSMSSDYNKDDYKYTDFYDRLSTYTKENTNGLYFYDELSGSILDNFQMNPSRIIDKNVILCTDEVKAVLKSQESFEHEHIISINNIANLKQWLNKELYITYNNETVLRHINALIYIEEAMDVNDTSDNNFDINLCNIDSIYYVNCSKSVAKTLIRDKSELFMPIIPITLYDTYDCLKEIVSEFNRRHELMIHYNVDNIYDIPLPERLEHNIQSNLYIINEFEAILTILPSLYNDSGHEYINIQHIRESFELIRKYGNLYGILCNY